MQELSVHPEVAVTIPEAREDMARVDLDGCVSLGRPDVGEVAIRDGEALCRGLFVVECADRLVAVRRWRVVDEWLLGLLLAEGICQGDCQDGDGDAPAEER